MSEVINRLIEQRKRAWDASQELRSRAATEEGLTAEERANYDKALDEVEKLSQDIEREERSAKFESVDFSKVVDERRADAGLPERSAPEADKEKRYEEAFSVMVRRGMSELTDEQRQLLMENRAQATSPGTAGGYTIPPGFLVRITETLKAFGGILNVAEVINTDSGNPLQWPSFDGTAQVGQILTENTQETALDLAFGTKSLGAYTYSSRIVQASLQLMQDGAFDLDGFVARQIGIRIGRAVAGHLATGTGTGQPLGLFTNATVGATVASGATTSISFDSLIDLVHSVDPAYRANGCRFVLNDSTLKAIRKLKDNQQRPLWEPSVQAGVPDLLYGYEYTVDQGVPVMAANAKSIGFGNVREAYVVRQVSGGQLLRLAERYADFLQVGYLGFLRLDATANDVAAFKVYQNSAT